MITVGKALEGDFEPIYAIDSLVFNPTRRNFLSNVIKSGHCFVARIDNTPVGFAVFDQSFFDQGFISLLIVHPDHRRRGVAKALIRHVESICPTEKLFTSTNRSNVIMQKVCENLGFVKSGYIENLDEGDPEIIYFKKLEEKA